VVPLASVTGFADPAVQFVLRFQPPLDAANADAEIADEQPAEAEAPAEPPQAQQVVSLDAFRRRTPPKN
jgi:hypothetical protein